MTDRKNVLEFDIDVDERFGSNLRVAGATIAEFAEALEWVETNLDRLRSLKQALGPPLGTPKKDPFFVPVTTRVSPNFIEDEPSTVGAVVNPALICAHGPRRTITGTNKHGPWVGHPCALPNGSEGMCEMYFVNTKKWDD